MNRAAQALSEMHPDHGDQLRLSREVGISQGYLSKLLRDQQRPGAGVRKRFWDAKRIAMHWWDEEVPNPEKPAKPAA